ncbi:hypothetical protein E2320_010529, partial [Naja naja]
KAFGIEDIVPDHRVVAQIGDKLALSCRTTDCESPYFSWRTQLDYPLGGKLSHQGKSSVLTIQSVGFQHEHQYLCTAVCKQGEPSKEKAVMSSQPMARVSSALLSLLLTFTTAKAFGIEDIVPDHRVVAQIGDKLALSCRTTDCESPYFSWRTQLDYPLGGKLSHQGKSSVLTIQSVGFQHEHQYLCTAVCKQGEPSKEKAVMVDIYYGPRNTKIVAFPGNTVLEGEALILTCVTESHPQASFVWKKQLPDGLAQNIAETYNLSIPNPQPSDSGTYTCEVTNEVTSVVETTSLYISVQASVFSTAASTLTTPPETTALTTPSDTTALTSETTALTSETTALTTPSETTITSDAASETTTSVTFRATLKTFCLLHQI